MIYGIARSAGHKNLDLNEVKDLAEKIFVSNLPNTSAEVAFDLAVEFLHTSKQFTNSLTGDYYEVLCYFKGMILETYESASKGQLEEFLKDNYRFTQEELDELFKNKVVMRVETQRRFELVGTR